ncbi:hypothetical protein COCC4DRAFT_154441 [Bipolaris maydis ATCC 48331]|uniref:BTB domain-containing protein n=3 Tax=Cochliobolus heterostrophus TaxID=5016 RepID=M2TG20_COCH5|nr:uncharacterized protein COCC4DRAFT_154441 [Bipolaris maydis ATCC 48331]EMD96365.1 hypothetical protein COCHEDRAFT_1152409 [Bipolaris maydis C5]ENH98962.1 hypothetical protein COCC4DRAFT_154441 [Bipolaris maydis ATCC 48331]KAJ5022555.1 hypothetical protein J3E73DRAFT_393700 [Bipolaris maydis]
MNLHEKGDVEVQIQQSRFFISSSVMSETSPEFKKLFTTQSGTLRKSIELPDEDPEAFYLVCQSAHGSFIPQSHISLQTLVNMADAIQRYKIPTTSRVHHTVAYSFITQTLRPETISTPKLLMLIRVAKVLGPTKYHQLLQDVFFVRPLQLGPLPTEHFAGGQDTDCVVLLANLMLRGAACRSEVASRLLSPPGSSEALHLREKNDLAIWILKEDPSLQEINTRLRSLRRAVDLQREQLLDASGAIEEATTDISRYVRTTMGNALKAGDNLTEEVLKLDTCHEVKRLNVRIAEDSRTARELADADDLDLERVSSSSTQFENMETYGESMENLPDGYLEFEDDESVASARTV